MYRLSSVCRKLGCVTDNRIPLKGGFRSGGEAETRGKQMKEERWKWEEKTSGEIVEASKDAAIEKLCKTRI